MQEPLVSFVANSLQQVRDANPGRRMGNMNRRLLKMYEEAGEFVQAFLHVTSQSNAKGKTWADVREEGIDTMVPILDVLLTEMPDQDGLPSIYREGQLVASFFRLRPEVPILRDGDVILRWYAKAGEFSRLFLKAHGTKKWERFRLAGLEVLHLLIMMLLYMPDDQGSLAAGQTVEQQRREVLAKLLTAKLDKWKQNRAKRQQVTEDDV